MNQRKRIQSANTDKLIKKAKMLENGNWVYKVAAEVMKFYKMFNRVHKTKIKRESSTMLCGRINHTFFANGIAEFPSAIKLLKELSRHFCNCCLLNWDWIYDLWVILDDILMEQTRMITKIQNYYSSEEFDPRRVRVRTELFVVEYNKFFDSGFANQKEFLKKVIKFLELGIDFYQVFVKNK